jgi:hypothetical protein
LERDISYFFKNFGEKIYYVGVLTALTIFTGGIVQIVVCILFLQALRNIKLINQTLANSNLKKFHFRLFSAVIIDLAGFAISLFLTGIITFHIINILPTLYPPPTNPLTFFENTFVFLISVLIFTLGIGFVRIILYLTSWSTLNEFFKRNLVQFPSNIVNKAIEGTGRLKKGYLLTLVGGMLGMICMILLFVFFSAILLMIQGSFIILSDFIIGLLFYLTMAITALVLVIIGFILTILGYFDLSHLKNL